MSSIEKYIVWGCGGHSRVIADVIYAAGGKIVAFVDTNPDIRSIIEGVPIFHNVSELKTYVRNGKSSTLLRAAIAIGGARGGEKQKVLGHLRELGLHLPMILHETAAVSSDVTMGEGCQVLAHAVVSSKTSIGSLCIVNNSANVDHECILGDAVHIAPGAILCGCVEVGDRTMIGAGAVILPRLKIGVDVVVGAGAVVTCDIPTGACVAGNPAKELKRV